MIDKASTHSRGFSLLELLTVIVIVSTLAVISMPSLAGLSRAGSANQAISGVVGILELARQQAVSQNTYTWVVLAGQTDENGINRVHALILNSKDGTNTSDGDTLIDLNTAKTYDVGNATSNLAVLARPVSFSGVVLGPLAPSPAPVDPTPEGPNLRVNFKLPASSSPSILFLNQNPTAQRIIEFTPQGQAKVSGAISRKVELGLQGVLGTSGQGPNVAAIQADGVTGQIRVYRP